MRYRVMLWAMVLLSAAMGASAAERDLFNGNDLTGWVAHPENSLEGDNPTWSAKDGVLHCTGQPIGYLRTEEEFQDYRISLEWRWPGKPGNNGLLVHIVGEDKVWPKSFEAQLQHEHAGDIWVIDGADFKEHVNKDDRRVIKKEESSEKPLGEWNRMEVVCEGDSISVSVNGVLQNEATETSHSKGQIGLQSEAAAIEYRNIRIEPIED